MNRYGVKFVPCMFFANVRCSRRKNAKDRRLGACVGCPFFKKFEAEMDAEDERIMNEIDDIRRRL